MNAWSDTASVLADTVVVWRKNKPLITWQEVEKCVIERINTTKTAYIDAHNPLPADELKKEIQEAIHQLIMEKIAIDTKAIPETAELMHKYNVKIDQKIVEKLYYHFLVVY